MLELKSVRVLVADRPVIDGLSLAVQRGEIVGLIGAPGCGKSTLLGTIFGLSRADAGEITYEGLQFNHTSPPDSIKHGVVLVPQGGRVFRTLTVDQNLCLAGYTLERQKVRERLQAIYEFFPRLSERRRQIAGSLSGGERQMLSLGMGIVMEPKLLLLDEPSTGLSPTMAERILQYIKDLSSNLKCSVLLVEQNIKNATQVSDRVLVMSRGMIAYIHDVRTAGDIMPLLDAYSFTRTAAHPPLP